jgi:hypothetical protein
LWREKERERERARESKREIDCCVKMGVYAWFNFIILKRELSNLFQKDR